MLRRMVRDLNFCIRIVGMPTVREADGLAMSRCCCPGSCSLYAGCLSESFHTFIALQCSCHE